MNRGRGRGRGRGGEGSGRKVRPTLPFKLTQELTGGSAERPGRGGSKTLMRKDRRKEERQAKKHKPKPQFPTNPPPRQENQIPRKSSGEKRTAPPPSAATAAVPTPSSKRLKTAAAPPSETTENHKQPRKKPSSSLTSSKFEELLPAAEDPEIIFQRQLAKKLGLKKGKKLGGADDDGLGELFEELGGLDDVLGDDGDDSDGSSEEERGVLTKKNKKKKTLSVAAPLSSSSCSSLSSSGDEESDSDSDSDDDSLLGGLNEEDSEEMEDDSDSDSDSLERDSSDEEMESEEESEEEIKPTTTTTTAAGKYVPPAVRKAQLSAAAAAAAGGGGGGDAAAAAEEERTIRRVRGLLNRLAEANLPGIVGDLAEMYQNEGRSIVSGAVSAELLSAAAEGPRASDRFAAVAAAAIAGLAGKSTSSGVIATFLAQVASSLESAMESGDSLAAGNLVQVVAHLYLSGALKPDLIFSLLEEWRARFHESDVVAMAGLLGAAGLALRAADPERMKEFVVEVHSRAAEKGAESSGGSSFSTRARVMLDLVVDIKNNRKRQDGNRKKVVSLDAAAAKWLKGCGVGAVALGGITWKKVLTGDKRGHWWMPTAADAAENFAKNHQNNTNLLSGGGSGGAAAAAAAGIGSDAGMPASELLKLASAMRMNTDARRAVFCAVMGSEDALDAFEKLLRLGLKGDQEREIVRVTVECCLHEGAYNPYYAQLVEKLCKVGKGHKITLQYCLWDHFKEVEGMEVRKMTNLARFSAFVVSASVVPSTLLKAVDFAEVMGARKVLFWRLFFENCFAGCSSDNEVASIFLKISGQPQLGALKLALGAFLKRSVGPWLASKDPEDASSGGAVQLTMLLKRCRLAERALL